MKNIILIFSYSVISGFLYGQESISQGKKMEVTPVQNSAGQTSTNDTIKVEMPTTREGKPIVSTITNTNVAIPQQKTPIVNQTARKPE